MPIMLSEKIRVLLIYVMIVACVAISPRASAAEEDDVNFADQPLLEPLVLPDWFKLSFLDLGDDLHDANTNKRGLIIYFGRHDCAYCKALLEKDWGRTDIVAYTQRYFDVIAIDVLGNRQLTDPQGKEMSEKAYAAQHKANFTPTLHIYDRRGKLALKLTGYRPPYQFKAALEYVADDHHLTEDFAKYYARAEPAEEYGNPELNHDPAIRYSDKLLDLTKSRKPVLILFEQPRCHACDILHGGPLQNPQIRRRLQQFNAVQLDSTTNQPIITPGGQRTTSGKWARELYMDYTPTLMFFDEHGNEVVRIDSVVWFYRLSNVLDYVLDKGYLQYPTFQQWRGRKKPN